MIKIKLGKSVVNDLVCLRSIKFHYLLLVTDIRYAPIYGTTGTTILSFSAKHRFGLIKAATLRKLWESVDLCMLVDRWSTPRTLFPSDPQTFVITVVLTMAHPSHRRGDLIPECFSHSILQPVASFHVLSSFSLIERFTLFFDRPAHDDSF